MTEPMYSSGVTTSTFMIGSRRTEPPFCALRGSARARGDFEGQDRVDVVERAVDQRRLHVDDREAGEACPKTRDRLDALVDAGDVFLRHRAADDRALEHVARAGSFGSNTILTRANWPVPPVCFLWV